MYEKAKGVLNSSKRTGTGRDDWGTPDNVLERLRKFRPVVQLDPTGDRRNRVNALRVITAEEDALKVDWESSPYDFIFMNCPYSQNLAFHRRLIEQRKLYEFESVSLTTARTDTRFFQLLWDTCTAIVFVKGRLRFDGAEHGAPFPSVLAYWGYFAENFETAFGDLGKCVRL